MSVYDARKSANCAKAVNCMATAKLRCLQGDSEFLEICKCPSRLNEDDGETSRMIQADNLETGRPTYVGTSKLASLAESLRVAILAAIPIPMEVSKHRSEELASPCSSDRSGGGILNHTVVAETVTAFCIVYICIKTKWTVLCSLVT